MRIFVLDDQQLLRDGLCALLGAVSGVQVSAASSHSNPMLTFHKAKPDVVILASTLEVVSAVEIMKRFLKAEPRPRVLVIGPAAEAAFGKRWIGEGAHGFISLAASSGELVSAVRCVAEGKRYWQSNCNGGERMVRAEGGVADRLTMRQLDVLRLLGEGHSLKAISEIVGVSYKTIANTCTRIKSKLGVQRTADLIRLAIELERGNDDGEGAGAGAQQTTAQEQE